MGKFQKSITKSALISFTVTPCVLIGHGGAGIMPAGAVIVFVLVGTLNPMYLGSALVTAVPAFLLLAVYFYFTARDIQTTTKPEIKQYEPGKIYEVKFDYCQCVNCPICNVRLKLDEAEVKAKEFVCTDCKSTIGFSIKKIP